jgi:hypothetical protein
VVVDMNKKRLRRMLKGAMSGGYEGARLQVPAGLSTRAVMERRRELIKEPPDKTLFTALALSDLLTTNQHRVTN